MIGIEAIGTYIPKQRVDTLQRAKDLSVSESFIIDKVGFSLLALKDATETTVSMAQKALENLKDKINLDLQSIEALAVITQNPDRRIPHSSADLHGLFQLSPSCACFDISLGCSGYVYGLSILSSFMMSNGLKKGVLVTADPYSTVVDPKDKNTSLIFGDAATATLLSDSPQFALGSFSFGTRGTDANNLAMVGNSLFMNGRAVFNFAASGVPESIQQVLLKNKLTPESIDRYILHQGSKYMLETIGQRLGINNAQPLFSSHEYGNTVSSSIPIILENEIEITSNKYIVLSGFGLGFSIASTVIRRNINE